MNLFESFELFIIKLNKHSNCSNKFDCGLGLTAMQTEFLEIILSCTALSYCLGSGLMLKDHKENKIQQHFLIKGLITIKMQAYFTFTKIYYMNSIRYLSPGYSFLTRCINSIVYSLCQQTTHSFCFFPLRFLHYSSLSAYLQ